MHLDESTVNQILELLREAGPAVFAAPEDADYFRKSTKPLPPEPKKSEPVFIPPQPAPQPAPQPPKPEVIFAPPPPPPPIPPPVKLQPLEPKPPSDLSSIRAILSVVAPELKILNEIPSDAIAKKISERWKTKNQTAPISILLYQEPPEQRVLLEQIAKALDVYFGPAKIVSAETIEKEKQWEAFLSVADLKMVIVIRSHQKKATIAHKSAIIPVFRHHGVVLRHHILVNFSASQIFYREVIFADITFTPAAAGEKEKAEKRKQ